MKISSEVKGRFLRLSMDHEISKVTIDLEDQHKGYACVSTGCVLPEYQRRGIYKKMIEEAVLVLKSMGFNGCFSSSRSTSSQGFWEKLEKQDLSFYDDETEIFYTKF